MTQDGPGSPRPAAVSAVAPSVEQYLSGFTEGLRTSYDLEPFGPFTIIVEGLTDVDYLTFAATKVLADTGFDLLDGSASGRADARISIRTPLDARHPTPEGRRRGGSKLLGRLIRFLRGYVSILESSRAQICFVVDHDEAGRGTVKAIKDAGFDAEYMAVTLDAACDPACFPDKCSRPDMVIEDLLSLRVQQAFFDQGGCDCRVTFRDGEAQRFEWDGTSKGDLPGFVRSAAALQDVSDLVQVLLRVRQLWGLPNPDLASAASTHL